MTTPTHRFVPAQSIIGNSGDIVPATEDGLALVFAAEHEHHLRYDHDRGRWFAWDGSRWKEDRTELAYDFARAVARTSAAANKRHGQLRVSVAVERAARADRRLAVTSEIWDADPLVMGVPGSILDLQTGQLRAADPRAMITRQTTVAPAPSGTSYPNWSRFLQEATGGDGALIRFLQVYCGYCLTGQTKEHALMFLYGPGGNGKSVFLNTTTAVLGEYGVPAAMGTLTARKFENHSTDLAMLAGARLVTASETEEDVPWAESRLKQMTGGDPVTARFMRQDNFSFRPQFKLMIAGNHAPTLRTVDDAMRRRLFVVAFDKKPRNPDKDLEAKLRAELPAIFRWMIDGCIAWQREGLDPPRAVMTATNDYFAEQDTIAQWLDDECAVDPDNPHRWETSGKLYASYTLYCKTRGEVPKKQIAWASHLQRLGFQRARDGKKGRFYRGIELKAANLGQ